MNRLQNCTPEFVRKCFPNQSGSVIFVDGIILLLTENSVLSTSAVSIILQTPEGERKSWHENGQLCRHCHYINNRLEGEYKWWWQNGQLCRHCHYVKGEFEGEFKWWYENGQLWEHCHYVNGILEGECKSWCEDGQLWQHEIWKNGRMVKDFLDTP